MCEALACNGGAIALLLAWLLDVMVRLLVRFFVCAVRFFVVRANRVLRVCLLVLQKNRREEDTFRSNGKDCGFSCAVSQYAYGIETKALM